MKVTMQTCNCCGENKKLENYYSSSSYFMKHTGKVHTCKQCLWDYVNIEEEVNYPRIKEALRMIDKPFLYDLWFSSMSEADNRDGNIFKMYMKNLAMKQNRELSWSDSQFEPDSLAIGSKDISFHTDDVDLVEYGFSAEELKRLTITWGNFSVKEYVFLENFYGDYKNNFPTDTPAQINIYKNLAKIHLQAEKELEKGNIKNYKDLMDLSSKMHSDGNIKPLQSSGMNDEKGLSTYGLWIKTIENDEPCEYFEDKPIYEDFDHLKKYIEKWLIRPFKNIFNVSKDFNVGDD